MEKTTMSQLELLCTEIDTKSLQTLSIAYIGDAYFHLYVRVNLLKYKYKVNDLHRMSNEIVSAVGQSKAYAIIESMLTEGEREIFRRGRNAKSHRSNSASNEEYHNSTGFETLLGTLFLKGEYDRLEQISQAAFDSIMKDND